VLWGEAFGYIDRELTPEEVTALERHLAEARIAGINW